MLFRTKTVVLPGLFTKPDNTFQFFQIKDLLHVMVPWKAGLQPVELKTAYIHLLLFKITLPSLNATSRQSVRLPVVIRRWHSPSTGHEVGIWSLMFLWNPLAILRFGPYCAFSALSHGVTCCSCKIRRLCGANFVVIDLEWSSWSNTTGL